MKKNMIFAAAAALLLPVVSCQREVATPDEIPGQRISIRASIADLSTKVDFAPTYDATYGKPLSMVLTWEDGDALRVYDHADRSRYSDFELDNECIGLKSGTFSGTPVMADSYDVEVIHGSFDYADQSQPSDGVTTNLKYLASATDVDDIAEISFSSFSSVLAITAQMPSSAIAGTIKSVEVKASSAIFNGGNTLSITFESVGDAGADGLIRFFATLPQGNTAIPTGTTLLMKFYAPGEDHDVYTRFMTLPATTFTAKKLNTINVSARNSASYANASSTGIGGETNPYLIGDKYQMEAMGSFMVADETTWFKMLDDIDLNGVDWVPLNDQSSSPKKIDFDGCGHTISNLTVGSSNNYPSFFGYLAGRVQNVVFDNATITCGDSKEQSGGVVAGYIGGNSNQGDCSNVTIRNSSITSGGGSAYVAGLGARIGKSGEIRNCHVINTSVSTATSGSCVGGLLSYIASNSTMTISGCSAENVTITAGGHYAGGLVAQIVSNNPVTIYKCHTTGSINRSSSGRHFGGLVGSIQSADVRIANCYSTCSVTGYQFNGGLVGSFFNGGTGTIDHCFASGNISDAGNSGDGGLVGTVEAAGTTITNSIAWNSSIAPRRYGDANYSSGAVVGRTHPNTNLQNNYRKPGMSLTAYWVPSAEFDHPNSQLNDGTYYIWKIGADLDEANGDYTTATSLSTPLGLWAYHGKHLPNTTTVTPDNEYGWAASPEIAGIPEPAADPESPSYTGTNVWGLGTTTEIVEGVTWTNYHGTWQGRIREINIITTTLNDHNKLRIYYNYSDDGKLYLNEKCTYVSNAVAATNGSMTSQFVRVDDRIKGAARAVDPWVCNAALTIDGDDVDIVKVADCYDAATLPNSTVSCAGPLLVWKGNTLTAPDEWLDADTEEWLTTEHPRTAIGINKEGTKLIQVTVDGRWESGSDDSKKAYGMSTDLLAELMTELGCYKAMNLDGGGGTQMWVYGKGDVHNFVNHPFNSWPVYGTEPAINYWIKDNEVARRAACCAVYIQSDLKR